MSMSKFATQADYWRDRSFKLEKMLLKCREEFCWHGNTGKHLNADCYGQLVDEIDALIDEDGVQNCTG